MATWFPVVTLVFGYVLSVISDSFKDRRTLQREREARKATRRAQMYERRVTFQRQTLLDLQDALNDLARAVGAIHLEDERTYHQIREWNKMPHTQDASENCRLAFRRMSTFRVRVHDDTVRELAQKFQNYSSDVTTGDDRNMAFAALSGAFKVAEELNERIGEILRRIDDDADSNPIEPV